MFIIQERRETIANYYEIDRSLFFNEARNNNGEMGIKGL